MDSDLGELSSDTNIIHRMKQFSEAIDHIERMIESITDQKFYDSLTSTDKIKYNLMMSFALNSSFWMHLRAHGVDPLNHPMKNENSRLKQAMSRAQEIRDRQTLMPRLNRAVANRFIRNGLWIPSDTCGDITTEDSTEVGGWDIVNSDQPVSKNDV